jgi:CDP-diacylglycerol--serine O-phosphatidyltransferase
MLLTGAILIFAAGLLDFLDGLAARLFKSYSELGKQLDSLADVVSFGVAPSVVLYQLLIVSFFGTNGQISQAGIPHLIIIHSAFLIALFSALRLAKFNIDRRQSDSFIGVPTPANAFFIASLPFILKDYPLVSWYILQPYILLPLIILLSWLLISEIPLISLKFKDYKWETNKYKYVLLVISGILIAIFRISAFPLIFILYVLISILENKFGKKAIQ